MAKTTMRRRKTAAPQLELAVPEVTAAPMPEAIAPVAGVILPPVPSAVVAAPAAAPPEPVGLPPFGAWLLRQPNSDNEGMAMLIGGAKADPRFPKGGDPEAVRHHLGARGADGDVFEAIDDAERLWLRTAA